MAPKTTSGKTAAAARSQGLFDLNALFEFSGIVNSALDLNFILSHYLLTLMGKLLSLRGMIVLRKEDALTVANVKGCPDGLIGQTVEIPRIPRSLTYVNGVDGRRHPWIGFFRNLDIHLLVPLVTGESVVGVAGFGLSPLKKKLAPTEEQYVKSLTNIAASAIAKGVMFDEVRDVNRRLDRKIHEMTTLFELGKEFNAVLDADRLVKMLMFTVMGQIGATRYFLSIEKEGAFIPVASRLDRPIPLELTAEFPNIRSAVTTDTLVRKNDQPLKHCCLDISIKTLVPLLIQGEVRGMIGLGDKLRGEPYTPSDLEFLTSLANLAMISLENARLFREAIEKQKMEDELLIAKEIQRGLLPKTTPDIPGFDFSATNISSKQVGGDYYDVIAVDDHRFVFAIGDVSGKGTPASLLMANLQATIRALVPLGLPLAELTKRVNDLICENTGSDRFITFFWGMLDTSARTFRYVSAGHNPPYLFRQDGSIVRLDAGGLILGIMKALVPYQEGEVNIQPGETLVLFTDGVSEAMSTQEEEWGEERLEAVVRLHAGSSSREIVDAIVSAIREHSRNAPQSDDITLVVAKALPG